MRGYSQLADLESLLLNIPDKNIRAYAGEAIASYSAGAYRSAIISIWIAVVYDLYQKFCNLKEQYGDPAAKTCIEKIDTIRNSTDKKQISAWERQILDNAYNDVKIITHIEHEHLERIQKDRHRCAHPVLDSAGLLFQPTPELVRTHIRTAIEVLLSKPPIIGKAIIDILVSDIENTQYFPDDIEGVREALYKRHFQNSETYKLNLLKFSLKKILFFELDDTKIIKRYVLFLACLLQEDSPIFDKLEKDKICSYIEKVKEERFEFLLEIIHIDPRFWDYTSKYIQEKLKIYCENLNYEKPKHMRQSLFALSIIPEFEDKIFDFYTSTDNSYRRRLISRLTENNYHEKHKNLVAKIIKTNIEQFTGSTTYDSASSNRNLISPLIKFLTEDNIKELLESSIVNQTWKNDQLYCCTSLFKEIFQSTIDKYPQTISDWNNFIEKKNDRNWIDFEELKEVIENKNI